MSRRDDAGADSILSFSGSRKPAETPAIRTIRGVYSEAGLPVVMVEGGWVNAEAAGTPPPWAGCGPQTGPAMSGSIGRYFFAFAGAAGAAALAFAWVLL